jgi:hypothetical protein
MDSCFSGFAVVARGIEDDSATADKIYEMWKKRAHVVVTAGNQQQLSWEYNDSSVFTDILNDALGENMLADANKDGVVTDAEPGQYLGREVPKAVNFLSQGKFTLNPQYFRGLQGDDVGQFLFIPRR